MMEFGSERTLRGSFIRIHALLEATTAGGRGEGGLRCGMVSHSSGLWERIFFCMRD